MPEGILNGVQEREFNRAQALNLLFLQSLGIITLSPSFNNEVKLFFNNNNELQSYVSAKKPNGKGITEDKKILKADVAEAAGYVCSMTTAYAIKEGNNDLKNAVAFTAREINYLKDGDILGFVNAIIAIVQPLLSVGDFSTGYSITQSTLDDLKELATSFNSNIGKASLVNTNRNIASRNIDGVLAAIRDNVVQFNLLIAFYEKTNPGFVQAYHTAAKIHDTGIRHSGIKGIIKNSITGVPVEGVGLILQGKKKTKETATDSDGSYVFSRFLTGKAKLTIAATGYESQVIEVNIIRGRTQELNISLQSAVVEFKSA